MGFIGLHTARAFLDAGEDIVVTRYRTTRRPSFIAEELGKRLFIEEVDMTDGARLLEAAGRHNVTGIVHLAVPALQGLTPAGITTST